MTIACSDLCQVCNEDGHCGRSENVTTFLDFGGKPEDAPFDSRCFTDSDGNRFCLNTLANYDPQNQTNETIIYSQSFTVNTQECLSVDTECERGSSHTPTCINCTNIEPGAYLIFGDDSSFVGIFNNSLLHDILYWDRHDNLTVGECPEGAAGDDNRPLPPTWDGVTPAPTAGPSASGARRPSSFAFEFAIVVAFLSALAAVVA